MERWLYVVNPEDERLSLKLSGYTFSKVVISECCNLTPLQVAQLKTIERPCLPKNDNDGDKFEKILTADITKHPDGSIDKIKFISQRVPIAGSMAHELKDCTEDVRTRYNDMNNIIDELLVDEHLWPFIKGYRRDLYTRMKVYQHQHYKKEDEHASLNAKFCCPKCDSFMFGSSQNEDGTLTRHCHGNEQWSCDFEFHEKDDYKYFKKE